MKEKIKPRLMMQLRDVNYKNDKTLNITDIDTVNYGPALLWLFFPDKESKNKANDILLAKNLPERMPETIDGKLYVPAYLMGEHCAYSHRYIRPVIKTGYQQDGFSGQFNFDLLPQGFSSFLLTLISSKHPCVEILNGVCKVQYRYGQYTIFFGTERDYLHALNKTFWQPRENRSLLIEISSFYQITTHPKGDKRVLKFDKMFFA